MSCVIRNSKEFKDLVNKFDIHPDNLEVILHKYLNTENRMPTDLEIMAELKGESFNASLEDFQWYSKNMLYEPLRYSSLDIAMSKATDLRNILGDSAVAVYRNSTGEYVVNVGTPKFEDMPFILDNSLIDVLLETSRETNPYHQMFKAMVEAIGKQNISIRQGIITNEKIRENRNPAAYYADRREIVFYPENLMPHLKSFTERGKKSVVFKILAHELVHQFTHDILATSEKELKTEAERKFHRDITALYEEAKKHISTDSYYGMKNIFEFIAEAITDRTFQKELAKIKSTRNKSLWQKFIDIFSRVFEKFGVNIHGTLLSDILSSTEELMADIEAMKEEEALRDEIFQDEMSESENAVHYAISKNNGYDLDKAPNGKPSKLFSALLKLYNGDREAALQAKSLVYSKSFRDWFGDWLSEDKTNVSKVVDENGEPLIVYHGTRTADSINKEGFQSEYSGLGNRGANEGNFYFTNSRINAEYTGVKPQEFESLIDVVSSVYDLFGTSHVPTVEEIYSLINSKEEELRQLKRTIEYLPETSFFRRVIDSIIKFFNKSYKTTDDIKSSYKELSDSLDKELKSLYNKVKISDFYYKGLKYLSGDRSNSVVNTLHFIDLIINPNSEFRQDAADKVLNASYGTDNLTYSPYIFPVFLNIKNPLVTDYNYKDTDQNPFMTGKFSSESLDYNKKEQEMLSELSKDTYDGAISKNKFDILFSDIYIAKNPNQIKSIDNQGTFSTQDNNIHKSNNLIKESEATGFIENENEPLGFKSESLDKLVNRYTNRLSDYTYYMLKVGETYAANVPVNSRETLEEAREKVRRLLRENGLDPDRYNIGKEFRNALGRTVIYVSPRTKKSVVKAVKESEATKFTEREEEFIRYLWDVRPDLAQRVIDGRQDIKELMLHEDELTVFAEPLNTEERENTSQESEYDIQDIVNQDNETQNTNQNQTIKEENKSYMERAVTITQQIDNLTNATVMSATEVRHIAEQAVYWISDHITRIQEEEGYAAQVYGEHLKDKDFASMSRSDVVKSIGADNLIARCKEQFSLKNIYYNSFSTRRKSRLITDNWRAIMLLASDAFLNVEDFSIVLSKDGQTSEVNTEIMADADNFSTSSNMEYDVLETEGDLQEHWQIETKTLDVLATMSQKVKQALLKCYLLDNAGNKITSEFGINERVNVREATNSILKWTQGALTLEQMISKLKEKTDSNPWIRQLITRLEDRSGKEADFQSQFFGTFYKPFQSYAVVIEENGRYKSIIVNENPALTEAMNQVRTLFKIGEHPMFNTKGVNKETYEKFRKEYEGLSKYTHKDFDINKDENKKEVAESLSTIANLLGYSATPEMIAANLNKDTFLLMRKELFYISKGLENNIDNPDYEPFEFNSKNGINGNMKRFLQPVTASLEDTAISAFYDNGKMYQSHVTPSYTLKLFQKFKLEGQAFMDFVKGEYGKYFWFFNGRDMAMKSGWRNPWLKRLVTESEARKVFKHKVQLNFNKKSYMKGMSDMEYVLSLITEYFSEFKKDDKNPVAWFKIPIMSNKPSSEFIRFYCYRHSNYKDTLVDGFKMIFDQELSRIQTVERRNRTIKKGDPEFIKNFDTNGKKFMFLDFMNEYLTGKEKSSELGKLLRDKLDGKIDETNEVRLNTLVKEAIMKAIEAKAESIVANWEKQGILEAAKKVVNIGNKAEEIRENLKNFVWNDIFASMNILQLAVTDIAFYKDAEDLQKRLAQIHSPGIRGNAKVTDYEGKMVTDGNFRTIKLADFDTFISNVIDNVSIVFDKKIANAPESAKAALRALKDSLVGKNGAFRYINVADSQGYSSPTSYRKKALIFGKWSREAEEVWNKLRKGEYNYKDLEIAFQPLKPFVYSQIEKNSEIEDGPMKTLKVPVQFKNSEYLLIMADALLRGEDTGKPNILRALYDVMEESHFNADGTYKLDGIDTVQFESTVKSGLMGKISLNDLLNDPHGEAKAKARLRKSIYKDNSYDNSAVDTVPFEDYCLQQEVPEHFKEHEQIHPSQLRYIITSELENFNSLGEPVTYNLEGKKVSAQEFKTEYENTIAENIQESLDELAEELSLTPDKIGNIKDRNITLSKILQKEILSSPRYGIDLLQACSVDENGEFRIPLGDPIQSKRVEQLINSIIKNRVNKQKIAGGPVVQVTSFGTSKELNIRFKDKDGNLLKTKAEWISTEAQGKDEKSINEGYKKYIRENQASIAYFEVFAPIYSNKLFNLFSDKNGFINIKAIEILCPDLLKMVGIRIPSEEKYSAAPLKIAGFLPKEAGDGIMFPADITLLTGSDFDIDKSYLMRLDLKIKKNKDNKEVRDILYKELLKLKGGEKLNYEGKKKVNALIDQFLDDPMDSSALTDQKVAKGYMTLSKSEYDALLKTYLLNKYTVTRPTEGRTYRNNKIVDMTYEVLTHETQADKIFNPSSFNQQKKMGYLVTAYKAYSDRYSWEELENMSIDELKDLINKDKNLSYLDTHVQFYRQNNAAASLIGVFAVNRVAHAVIESGSNDKDGASVYYVNVDKVCNLKRNFEVAGMGFGGSMPFDMRYDRQNQLIGKVFGSLILASTDAAKEPVLNLMNINMNTANILTALIRLGMPFDDAALFLSQSTISDLLEQFSRENINGYKSLNRIIQEKLNKIEKEHDINENSAIVNEELTREELIEGIKPDARPEIAYKVLYAFSKFQKIAGALRMPTFATRFNSIVNAVGPLVIDNLITEYQMDSLSNDSHIVDSNGNEIDMATIFKDHPILDRFSETINMAKRLFGTNMPANSQGFRSILYHASNYNLEKVLLSDRKLLSALSDFYQSYLLIKSGTIKADELKETISEFPKAFMKSNYKEKYPDNALIQAIKYGTDKSGRATLQIDITGLDTQQKEKYVNAWIDLHKENPELSFELFKYNFFRSGIGFSPKTFMSLVPVFVKERIAGYVDTFRRLPSTTPEIILDQFIRNNWDNNRLVPRRKLKHLEITENGEYLITEPSDISSIAGIKYFKVRVNGKDMMFKTLYEGESSVTVTEVKPLGSNKEYIEMSESDIETPLSIPVEAKVETTEAETGKETEIPDIISDSIEVNDPSSTRSELEEVLYKILVIDGVRTEEGATKWIRNFKSKSEEDKEYMKESTKEFFKYRLEKLGLKDKYDDDKIEEIFKSIC